MGENGTEGQPARLPGNAPEALRQFVACATDRVELNLTDTGWVPKPAALPDAVTPEVTVEDGWTPSAATIRVGWGIISIGLPATIVDGRLRIDSTGLGFGIGDEIDPWVDAFNSTLRDNGKQLDSFAVDGHKITMTKRAIPAGAPSATAVAAGGEAVAGTDSTEEPPHDPPKRRTGCLAWIIGAVVAVAAAIGLFLATTGDDDSATTGSIDPAATSSTTTSTTTSTTSTTIAQVGQVPEDDAPGIQLFCGDFDPELNDTFSGDLDGYMLIGGNCEIDGTYLPKNSDDGDLPRSVGMDPVFIVAGPLPGWTHEQSQPDAFTGEVGPTFSYFDMFERTWTNEDIVTAFLSSKCGDEPHSGIAAVQPDGTATPEHPIFNFGECQVGDLGVIVEHETGERTAIYIPPGSLENFGLYAVGPDEQVAGAPNTSAYPQIFGPDSVGAGWSDSVQTIANVLGGTELAGPQCNSMVEPAAILGGDALLLEGSPACTDRFWVFAAAQQSIDFELTVEDTVTGSFATFVNPLGEIRPAIADTIDRGALAPLFDGRDGTPDTAIFPCGFGHVALTLCTPEQPSMQSDALVSVGVATGGPIPTEWDGTPRSYAVEFDAVAAIALLDEAGWSLESSGDDRVRALIRDDSITFVFPQDAIDPPEELAVDLLYTLTSMIGGKETVQPAVPVVGLITSPPSLVEIEPEEPAPDEETAIEEPPASPELIETVNDFYPALSASIAAGDVGFAFDRLAPTVFEAYPTQCPAALESFADPELSIVPISEGAPEPWTWELADGRSFEIPNAIPVTVVLTGRGQPGTETETHLQIINGQYHWFTLCE